MKLSDIAGGFRTGEMVIIAAESEVGKSIYVDRRRCPDCGGKVAMSERSVNGKTTCVNGHTHPHSKFFELQSDDSSKKESGNATLKCPKCGESPLITEKRKDGYTYCQNNHKYLTSEFLK